MRNLKKTLAVLVAATMLSSTPVWAKDWDESKLPNHVKETYEEVLELVPQLQEYEKKEVINSYGNYIINIDKKKRGEYPSATIEINGETGDFVYFEHISNLEESSNPPSDELAKEKATEFLKEILDDKFEQYKFDNIKEHTVRTRNDDEDGSEIIVERDVKRVYFTTENDNLLNLEVIVDTEGTIYSVLPILTEEKLDQKIRKAAERVFEVVPELKEGPYKIFRRDRSANKSFKRPELSLMRDEILYSNNNGAFIIDNITGELNNLYIDETDEKSNTPISKEVAKVKAAQFIQQVIEDSEKYKFVALGTPYSEVNDSGTVVGFTTPFPEDERYVKHLQVYVAQNGKILSVKANVEEESFDFEQHYKDLEQPLAREKK
ncbi:hypothetical protein E8L90_23970 [Brevibacillus antibioticus]|uniref:PepSY domain-containing protein n=1 Tax=Brevibacillus antibioticus TaxID=2570228 RepID=A0A4U2YBP8_9BACL|nr:hypothetical protein [Brevibacillus antibioticus]TKI58198.1 hypothetical protein E8L90_23970 [Brevibacillus antibioticus]